jgi:hypothetical protein
MQQLIDLATKIKKGEASQEEKDTFILEMNKAIKELSSELQAVQEVNNNQ